MNGTDVGGVYSRNGELGLVPMRRETPRQVALALPNTQQASARVAFTESGSIRAGRLPDQLPENNRQQRQWELRGLC